MTQDYKHPITPPPELVQQWASEWMQQQSLNRDNFMATRASQYGSDQELEACCEWLDREGWSGESRQLRAARRPKPPSLKVRLSKAIVEGDERQALKLLEELDD
jgi:hypothetical protein